MTMSPPDPIMLSEYDDTWPVEFQQIATTIRRAFDAAELDIPRIDHIGSTAIPGMAAKAVIDIQIAVTNLEPMVYRPSLESLGYHWRAHNPELTKRMFRETRPMRRTHIHVRRLGSWHEQFALLFRDYLRVSASDADRYHTEKKRLARQYKNDRTAYTEGKGPTILDIIGHADRWAADEGWEPGPTDA